MTVTDAVEYRAVYVSDADGDGYAPPEDCNDNDSSIHPGATEHCNGDDDDCDGQTDEEGASGCTTYYRDNDNDGYGEDGDTKCLCSPSGAYWATQGGDCNDNDYSVHPGATEYCNGVNDDCDGQTDEEGAGGCTIYYRDSDNDAYGVRGDSRCLCSASGDYRATQAGECDDTRSDVNPGATESCNGRDDNCSGQADEQGASGCTTYYRDSDNDGFGVVGDTRCQCSASEFYTATEVGDCNDSNPNIYPGAPELCRDQIDNDCDQQADCADASCDSDPACAPCGDDLCDANGGETSCGCSADCGAPPASEIPAVTCADGVDNDCDGAADDDDADCSDCGNGDCEPDLEEDQCTCVQDCGDPPASEDPATTCADGLDNDCDDLIDCDDPDCACDGGPVCSEASGNCCEANDSPGCEDETCCAAVCACDPFCCENEWDSDCALHNTIVPGCDAATLCGGTCGVFHSADMRQSWSDDCSCATCNDGRIDECEAAGYAEAWQRGEHDDMVGGIRALYLWINGACYAHNGVNEQWIQAGCE